MMPYSEAQNQEPGSLYFKVGQERDWKTPTSVAGFEAMEDK